MTMAHQIATKAIGGEVYVSPMRDTTDGTVKYAVAYTFGSAGAAWLSTHRFPDLAQAESGALILADFLGAGYRA